MKSVAERVEKRCPRCKDVKPLDGYHRNRKHSDGHHDTCKACRKLAAQDWSEEKREAARRAVRKSHSTPEFRARDVEYKREYQRRPDVKAKHRARNAVKDALLSGRIVRPTACTTCNSEGGTLDAHHPDYNRPLDVFWLCRPCHAILHSERPHRFPNSPNTALFVKLASLV